MSLKEGPNVRTIAIVVIIFITLAFLFRLFAVGLLVARLAFVAIFIYFIWRYLDSQRGYQDRYTSQGRGAANMKYMLRLAILFVVFIFTFSFTASLLDDVALAFFINAVAYFVIVQFADEYFSRDMVQYVAKKRKDHQDFVDSISDPANIASKCMSCQKPMNHADEQFCPHCGFEQREIKKDSSYAGSR